LPSCANCSRPRAQKSAGTRITCCGSMTT
jgi:hypothetical protein